ncbi:hypothetical protein Lalb_Chr14g0362221 [Lupinus albus]|uniref:Uncharacterized protein n=1 Tax=Lupinus albus TaxID=3870 RepID=A0A6A4PEZ9_LUPAL|nr:hypothetical protein Lalb_Chr14g0362221 [Lupinus albus]
MDESSQEDQKLWNVVWKSLISLKSRVLAWRIILNMIPYSVGNCGSSFLLLSFLLSNLTSSLWLVEARGGVTFNQKVSLFTRSSTD